MERCGITDSGGGSNYIAAIAGCYIGGRGNAGGISLIIIGGDSAFTYGADIT